MSDTETGARIHTSATKLTQVFVRSLFSPDHSHTHVHVLIHGSFSNCQSLSHSQLLGDRSRPCTVTANTHTPVCGWPPQRQSNKTFEHTSLSVAGPLNASLIRHLQSGIQAYEQHLSKKETLQVVLDHLQLWFVKGPYGLCLWLVMTALCTSIIMQIAILPPVVF